MDKRLKALRTFFLLVFFSTSDIPVTGFLETSSVRAEEVIQLARLSQRRGFVRRASPTGSSLRTRIKASKNRGFGHKVFSSPRNSRARQNRKFASRRFVPQQPVVPAQKRFVNRGGGAIGANRAVLNGLRLQQSEIRIQFSTARRRE